MIGKVPKKREILNLTARRDFIEDLFNGGTSIKHADVSGESKWIHKVRIRVQQRNSRQSITYVNSTSV